MRRCWFMGLACLGLVAAGCGSSSDESNAPAQSSQTKAVAIDIGAGKTIQVKTAKPRIGFYSAGASNLYLRTFTRGVVEEAKRQGLDLTTIDAKFDAARQMEQLQNGLQQKRYDAFLVVPLDGALLCPVLTKQAPAQGIPVVTALVPACNRALDAEGADQWSPGTVAQVQNDSTYTEDQAWVDAIAKRLPGKHTVAVLNGPKLLAVAKSIDKAVEYGRSKYPNIDFRYTIYSDFTTPTSLAKVQTLLQAHPDIDGILSMYSDMTIGAVKAVKAAGKSGSIKVFDIGGSQQSFDAIRAGEVEMTTYHTPHQNGIEAVKAVSDAFAGKKVPRYIGVYGPGASLGHPLIVDKSNVDKYKPQY
jgi:ribose transport system substrate-binding protein